MRHASEPGSGWQWSKFVLKRGSLRASSDRREVSLASRYTANILAPLYQRLIVMHVHGRVIDMGCGKAPLYGLYRDRASEVVRVDWLQGPHTSTYVDVFCNLNDGLPFRQHGFDTVVMTDVIEHVVDPTWTFCEAARLLAPGGRLILTTPFGYGLHEDPHDYHRLTVYKLRELCERNDLQILELSTYGGPVEVVLEILARALARNRIGHLVHQALAWLARPIRLPTSLSQRMPLGYALVAQRPVAHGCATLPLGQTTPVNRLQEKVVKPTRVVPPGAARVATSGLSRNAAWMFIGQTGTALGFWALMVILARVGGAELLGQFSLATAVVTPIILFSNLGLRQIQAADATGRFAFAEYRAVRVGTTGAALFVIAAVADLGGYPAPVAMAILILCLGRAIESLSDIYYGVAQRHERLDRIAQSLLLRTGLGLAAFALGLGLSGALVGGLLAQAAVSALVWWFFDRWATRLYLAAVPQRGVQGLRFWSHLVGLGLPLGVAMLLASLNLNAPRYVIEDVLGFTALGIFAALAHFVFACHTVITAVCDAAYPRLANLFAARELHGFRRLLLALLGFGLLVGVGGLVVALVLGGPLLELLYGTAFAAHAGLFAWVMAVGLVYCVTTPFNYSLSAMHRFRIQLLIQGLPLGVSILACLILTPAYGLVGAVAGWGAAVGCQGLLAVTFNIWYMQRADGWTKAIVAGEGTS
jgi:O-antigen/teichoic acid export membrane protein/SAM-dependent methyltransferase